MTRPIVRQLDLAVLLVALCALGPLLTGCGGGGDIQDEREPARPPLCQQRPEVCL